MSNNFVDIVGYQFERVHTRVISWLLDTNNPTVSLTQKYDVLSRIHQLCQQSINFSIDKIKAITCIPEYSFGRKRKIDLVVKIDLLDRDPKYLVIEMKVDSIPYLEQLQGTRADFLQKTCCKPEDALFLLCLLGSAQVCAVPDDPHFHLFKLPDILQAFDGLGIHAYVYEDWIKALKSEEQRRTGVGAAIAAAPQLFDEGYWRTKGYRTWFPLFYYIYSELKRHSADADAWEIYSGHNNPVLNWKKGWLDKNIRKCDVQFYWEFNYQDFFLKVKLAGEPVLTDKDLNWLRDEVEKLCCQTGVSGRKTKNRYGIYNSLYKWEFDFKTQNLKFIMNEAEKILAQLRPKLEQHF